MVKRRNFGQIGSQKIEILSKVKIPSKKRNFGQKIEMLVKNRKFGQKSKFWSKIESLVKNRNFGHKYLNFYFVAHIRKMSHTSRKRENINFDRENFRYFRNPPG